MDAARGDQDGAPIGGAIRALNLDAPGSAPGVAQRLELAAPALGRLLVRGRERSQQRIRVEVVVGARQGRGQPVPVHHVRRHPYREPTPPIGPRRIVGDIDHGIPALRRPPVFIATAVVRGHHQHVAGPKVCSADQAGARIVHAGPTKRPAVNQAQVLVEIIFALGHVGDAGGACGVPAPQPAPRGPDRHGEHLRTARAHQLQDFFQLVGGGCIGQVAGKNVAAPHQGDFRRRALDTVQEQPDFRIRVRCWCGVRPEIKVGGHHDRCPGARRAEGGNVDPGPVQLPFEGRHAEVHAVVRGDPGERVPGFANPGPVHGVVGLLGQTFGRDQDPRGCRYGTPGPVEPPEALAERIERGGLRNQAVEIEVNSHFQALRSDHHERPG